MKRLLPSSSSAPLGLSAALVTVLAVVSAVALILPSDAYAGASACQNNAALQRRLDKFDEHWNASDAKGLTAQFALGSSVGAASEASRSAVYRELMERLGRSSAPRQTQVVRAVDAGKACLVEVTVRSGGRREAGLFLLAHAVDGGIVAMR